MLAGGTKSPAQSMRRSVFIAASIVALAEALQLLFNASGILYALVYVVWTLGLTSGDPAVRSIQLNRA